MKEQGQMQQSLTEVHGPNFLKALWQICWKIVAEPSAHLGILGSWRLLANPVARDLKPSLPSLRVVNSVGGFWFGF